MIGNNKKVFNRIWMVFWIILFLVSKNYRRLLFGFLVIENIKNIKIVRWVIGEVGGLRFNR